MSTFEGEPRGITRRDFLGAVGAGAVAPALLCSSKTTHAQSLEQSLERALRGRHVIRPDRFGRLFPELPPFGGTALNDALAELGKKGGVMDAKDNLALGPVKLITQPAESPDNVDNPKMTAGVTFFGQFLDHDLTFDLNSRLGVPTVPQESPNERTPALDLDSVYGGGPNRSPELYQRSGRGRGVGAKLRIEHGGMFEDLPRTRANVAIIGDPRNDENMMISGFHAAMILFHNKVVDMVAERNRRDEPDELYRKARRIVTWHYQWIIVHEFLPTVIGENRVARLLASRERVFPSQVPFIPVEFQGAAYRMGHSMVRPSYRANLNGDVGGNPDNGAPAFFGMIFDPAGEGQADPVDLRGFTRAPRRFIGWQTFFKLDEVNFRPNKLIDTKISTALFNLPIPTIAGAKPGDITSLPQRNLLRHVTWGIPSGQAIAREIGVAPLTSGDLEGVPDPRLARSTPLWFYVLREAQLQHRGEQLGDVGANVVGRVFIGLLQLDRDSYLAQDPRWRPTLPSKNSGQFEITDLLTLAGVVDRTRPTAAAEAG
jgi:hypothetical protein